MCAAVSSAGRCDVARRNSAATSEGEGCVPSPGPSAPTTRSNSACSAGSSRARRRRARGSPAVPGRGIREFITLPEAPIPERRTSCDGQECQQDAEVALPDRSIPDRRRVRVAARTARTNQQIHRADTLSPFARTLGIPVVELTHCVFHAPACRLNCHGRGCQQMLQGNGAAASGNSCESEVDCRTPVT